jgi:hypothetical protein
LAGQLFCKKLFKTLDIHIEAGIIAVVSGELWLGVVIRPFATYRGATALYFFILLKDPNQRRPLLCSGPVVLRK